MEQCMRAIALLILLLALSSCGAQRGYNQSYHDMPPPLALYFDNGIRHLSFSAKLALLDRVDYMNDNPDLKAEIIGYDNSALALQLAHIVEREFLDQGISSRRIKIIPPTANASGSRPHVAIRLK